MFTIIAAFFVPVIGASVLCAAGRLRWKAVIAGFFFYGLSQALLRLPLLWLFYQIPGMTSFVYSNLLGNALVMGLSAALSEECMRYVGARFAMGRRGQPVTGRDALGYGLGHSIAETFFVMASPTRRGRSLLPKYRRKAVMLNLDLKTKMIRAA